MAAETSATVAAAAAAVAVGTASTTPASVATPGVAAVAEEVPVASEEPKRRRIDIGALLPVAMKVAAGLVIVGALAAGALWGKDKWAELANTPQRGTVTIGSSPAGAEVLVDGTRAGVTPVSLDLEAGTHAVELRLKGAKKSQTIDVARGQTLAVNVDWKARRYGSLNATSVPNGAKVVVDGRERGKTPLVLDDLTVGAHSVVLESPEGAVRRRVVIAEGKTEALNESIFPGWLHVSAPIEVVVSDGAQSLQLDSQGRVLLKPGMHDIRIANESLDFVLVRRIEIEPGDTTSIDLESPQSELTVNGPTGAAVFIDGDKVGETPLIRLKVKVGSRDVKVVDRNGASYHMTVTVTTKPAEVNVDFAKRD